jgi:hypothetical protein
MVFPPSECRALHRKRAPPSTPAALVNKIAFVVFRDCKSDDAFADVFDEFLE